MNPGDLVMNVAKVTSLPVEDVDSRSEDKIYFRIHLYSYLVGAITQFHNVSISCNMPSMLIFVDGI